MPEPLERKIIAPDALAERLAALRGDGRTVVQCHGCFDIVHPGHLRYLQFARQLGDVLVVSLTGDEGVGKGPDRPYIPQELRAESLAALEFVDFVVIDPHPTARELLERLRPDVYVKGREYATASDPRFIAERQVVESHGGRVVFHSGDVVFSSTRLMESMQPDAALDEQRLRVFCARNEIDAGAVSDALGAFAGRRVVVLGDLVCERYVHCDASATADDAPALALQQLGADEHWGGAAAVARQVRALGGEAFLLAAVGRDEAAERARHCFDGPGYEIELLPVRETTVQRTTFVADETKLFKVTDGIRAPLDSSAERRAAEIVSSALQQADALIWCDHGYGTITPGLVHATGHRARRSGVMIAGHAAGQWGQLTTLAGADLLVATERQLREAMHDMSSGLPAVAWNLLSRTRGRRLVVGLHKRGLIGFDGDTPADGPVGGQSARRDRLRSEFVASPATQYADLAGADESVLACAALTLSSGRPLAIAIYIAAAAEAIAVSRAGGEPTPFETLQSRLAQRPELRPDTRFLPDVATAADIANLAPPLPTGAAT